jgi:hypothetical protein
VILRLDSSASILKVAKRPATILYPHNISVDPVFSAYNNSDAHVWHCALLGFSTDSGPSLLPWVPHNLEPTWGPPHYNNPNTDSLPLINMMFLGSFSNHGNGR